MSCNHTRDTSRWVDEYEDHWGIVEAHWEYSTENTYEDIDLHRYRCTMCNTVFYYSGRAREHFEEGKKFPWITGLE